ncbi:hypothetical protein D5R81_04810 [Parashewanella spongiae]|uniref:Uncharacterized protein n=1 Tax=Parashewanella spongiae TaxID=342950 RepID=A0A3A6TZV7_9GAMM|nr:hypothetical protein [Parashewanella spongiae]MCL1077283.1 hypothetical protein [Parashewanella spongiae]RJY18538.1 hypothetical protein D5R81_04810 [Parashewanella spongiae]
MIISNLILQVLSKPTFDHFSVIELHEHLSNSIDDDIDSDEVTKLVEREVEKLVHLDWIKQTLQEATEFHIYHKTSKFDADILLSAQTSVGLRCRNSTSTKKDFCGSLTDRLKMYTDELLLGVGQIEEYERIEAQHPELHDRLKPKYKKIIDSNNKLLGNIVAVEYLLECEQTN